MIRALLSIAIAGGLMTGLASAAPAAKACAANKPHKTAADVFKALDKNGDGKITLDEFTARAKGDKEFTAKLTSRFNKIDANHDGVITSDELKAAWTKTANRHHRAHAGKKVSHPKTAPATQQVSK
jgi:Ca2+-binding EF-hand superfamily protein